MDALKRDPLKQGTVHTEKKGRKFIEGKVKKEVRKRLHWEYAKKRTLFSLVCCCYCMSEGECESGAHSRRVRQ